MKPYVICHMLSSLDGRTLTEHWKLKEAAEIYEGSAATIASDGWIVGRKTMSEFSSRKPRRKRQGRFRVEKSDFVAPHTEKTYAVAIDPSGKLSWENNHVESEHVIEVLTEKVGGEYLDYLRSRNVSYLFGGKTRLDLRLVLEKLNRLFGVTRITLQGGGRNNGSFLNAGLVDELSLILVPVADGEMGTPSVFDIDRRDKKKPSTPLTLVSAERYKEKYLWLRYKMA